MATNLQIDPELLERALRVSGERTKKAAVTRALKEFIARRQQKQLLDLFASLAPRLFNHGSINGRESAGIHHRSSGAAHPTRPAG